MLKIEEITEGQEGSQSEEMAEDDIWNLDDEDSEEDGVMGIDERNSDSKSSSS
jgi:hypothetical protein